MANAPTKFERQRAANILGAFALALTDKVSAAVKTAGLSNDTASAAVVQIGFEPGISIERLRNCLALSHSATVRLIDSLQAENLVSRERNAAVDSRVAVLKLTPKGKAQMRATLAARAEITEPIVQRLSAAEMSALLAILDKALPCIVEEGSDSDVVCRLCDLDSCPQDRCPVCPLGAATAG